MMLKIKLIQENSFTSTLLGWQIEHTKTLTGPRDVYWLNRIVYGGIPFILQLGEEPLGYCAITRDHVLSELFLMPPHRNLSSLILKFLLDQNRVSAALVSTRDPLLLSICLDFNRTVTPIAYLFQDLDSTLRPDQKFPLRLANPKDRVWIEKDTDYARDFDIDFARENLWILTDHETKLGYGTFSPNPIQPEYSDIGAWVDPSRRNQDLGKTIILHLKEICYDRNLIPTCGCDSDNLSSKRMLEKAGFFASGRMLKIEFAV